MAQHIMLRGLACQTAQGYLYSKPIRADEVREVRHRFGSDGVAVLLKPDRRCADC